MVKVSVVSTFWNEVNTIKPFVEGLLSQSRKPDEIVLCDGGSNDGTLDIIDNLIKEFQNIRLIVKPGNRSVGRNEAIRNAQFPVIAVTDVGTIADIDWLKYLIQPFEDDDNTSVVAGFFKIKPETFFEEISASLMLNDHEHIDPKTWLPSSRSVAFTKHAWEKAGGYPEYTKYNEDTPFDLALKKAGFDFVFAEKAIVYWRPRPDLRSFYKQYNAYAIGDGLDNIFHKNYIRKILFYGVSILLVGLSLFKYSLFLIPVILFGFYLLRRSRHMWRKRLPIKWLLWLCPVIITNDVANILGYMRGLYQQRYINHE